jgi:hypothetical protein
MQQVAFICMHGCMMSVYRSKIMTSHTHPVQRTVEVRRARSRSRCSRVLSHTREQHKCDRGCEEQHGSIGGLDWDRGNWAGTWQPRS